MLYFKTLNAILASNTQIFLITENFQFHEDISYSERKIEEFLHFFYQIENFTKKCRNVYLRNGSTIPIFRSICPLTRVLLALWDIYISYIFRLGICSCLYDTGIFLGLFSAARSYTNRKTKTKQLNLSCLFFVSF